MPKYVEAPETYSLQCAKCGHQFKQQLAGLEANTEATCPRCGAVTRCDTQKIRADLQRANQKVDELAAKLRRVGK